MGKKITVLLFAVILCVIAGSALADNPDLASGPASLAIVNFSNAGQISGLDGTATDAVTSDIVKIHNFQVYDRKHLQSVMAEQKLGLSGAIDTTTAAKIGQLLGVKYIMVGSVNGVTTRQPGHYTRSFWDDSTVWVPDTYETNVTLNVSIIDVNTGLVAFSTRATGDSPSKDAADALSYAVYDACRAVYKAYPIRGYVIKVNGKQCYLDVGTNFNVTKGDKFIVTNAGESFVNPVTGKVLSQKKNVAVLEVSEVMDEMCIANIVKDNSLVKDAPNTLTVGDTVVRVLRDKPSRFLGFGNSDHVY